MADIPNWKKNKQARDAAYRAEHYSRIVMEIPKERKAQIQELAAGKGLSLTAYIMDCVDRMEEK